MGSNKELFWLYIQHFQVHPYRVSIVVYMELSIRVKMRNTYFRQSSISIMSMFTFTLSSNHSFLLLLPLLSDCKRK